MGVQYIMSSWATDLTANRLNRSYINGFLDVSGNVLVKGNIDVSGSGSNILTTTSGTNILRNGAIDRITTSNADTKIFGRTYAGWRTDVNSIEINTFKPPDSSDNNTNMFFHSGGAKTGGGGNDYDARITSVGGINDINGRGTIIIEDGSFTLNSFTRNELQVGGTPRITTTSALNTLSNTNNTLTATNTTATANLIDATGTGGGNTIQTTTGTNLITTTTGTNILKVGADNKIETKTTQNFYINDAHYIKNLNNTITYASFDGLTNISNNTNIQLNATSKIDLLNNGETMRLIGTNHCFIGYYPQGLPTRKAYFGFPSAGNIQFQFINEIPSTGEIYLESVINTINARSSGSNILKVNTEAKITTTSLISTFANGTNLFTNIDGTLENLRLDGNNTMNTTGANIFRVNNIDKITTTSIETNIYGATNLAYKSENQRIECNVDGTNVSYMDFHSGGVGADYDTRIISTGGTTNVFGQGTLQIISKKTDLLGVSGEIVRIIGNPTAHIGFYPTGSETKKGYIGYEATYPALLRMVGLGTAGKVNITSEATSTVDAIGILALGTGAGIFLEATNVVVNSPLFTGNNTTPLCNFTLSGTSTSFNGTDFHMSIGNMPDNSTSNATKTFMLPFRCRVVAWSLSGDEDAHVERTLRMRISTEGFGSGIIYYDQQGVLTADRLKNKSVCMGLNGNINGWTDVGFNNPSQTIPAGTQLFCYCNTSGVLINEFNITLFFQQYN